MLFSHLLCTANDKIASMQIIASSPASVKAPQRLALEQQYMIQTLKAHLMHCQFSSCHESVNIDQPELSVQNDEASSIIEDDFDKAETVT